VAVGIGGWRTLDDRFQRPNFPAAARLLNDRAGPRDPVVYYGPAFHPFVLADTFPIYLRRKHLIRAADTRVTSVVRSFGPRRQRQAFLVEMVGSEHVLPPKVPRWKKVEQRTFAGHPPVIVAVYAGSGP
jgi:hypothetical protein